jgi:hypothetical protein
VTYSDTGTVVGLDLDGESLDLDGESLDEAHSPHPDSSQGGRLVPEATDPGTGTSPAPSSPQK